MAIYLDIIWALNFLFDSLLLYLTAILLKRDVRLWRILMGGLIGSVIILLSITPLHSYSSHPMVKLLFSVVMVMAAFGFKRLTYFLKGLMTFYLTTFLIGGSLIGVHYFLKFDNDLTSSVMIASVKGFGDPISWLFVLLGFPIAWHLSKKNMESLEMTKIQYDSLIQVWIEIKGKKYQFKGLVDSGNQLYDPISRMPVMFVSIKDVVDQLPKELVRIAQNPDEAILGKQPIHADWESLIKVIPSKVVGSDHQLILAIKPDSIVLETNEEIIDVEKGLVSFSMQQLSADDAFQCIVHPKMLTGAKKVS